jgi:hypothetical protein
MILVGLVAFFGALPAVFFGAAIESSIMITAVPIHGTTPTFQDPPSDFGCHFGPQFGDHAVTVDGTRI